MNRVMACYDSWSHLGLHSDHLNTYFLPYFILLNCVNRIVQAGRFTLLSHSQAISERLFSLETLKLTFFLSGCCLLLGVYRKNIRFFLAQAQNKSILTKYFFILHSLYYQVLYDSCLVLH